MKKVVVAGTMLMLAGITLAEQGTAQQERGVGAERHGQAREAAHATLQDGKGRKVGEVTLRETAAGVLFQVNLTGVPAGTHGVHLHDVGRCEAPTFESAGGHFNPGGKHHGFLAEGGPHVGDLPNVHVGESGRVSVELLNASVTLKPGATSLLDADGTAIVVHSAADDYLTDPAGGAGDRIACGVVERGTSSQ